MSISNCLLTELEFHLTDQLLERAEQLIAEDRLSPVQEVERNLWLLHTIAGPSYEIEIQISPSRIKGYTCECEEAKGKKACMHIVAALLLVREQRKKRAAKKVVKPRRKSGPTRLTTTTILDHIGLEELKDFIKAYAKENKAFSLALKTRFAPTVSLPDSLEKYTYLLDSTINSVRRQALKFSKKASVQILKVCEEILHHAEDALLTRNYSESFAICHSIFSKLIPLLPKAEDKTGFQQMLHRNFSLLKKLIQGQLAPQLKEKIWEYICVEAFTPMSRLTGFDQQFLDILLFYSRKNPVWSQQAIVLVDIALTEFSLNENSRIHLLLAKMNLLDRSKEKEAFNQLIHENLGNRKVLRLALTKAKETGDLKRCKQLAEYGLNNQEETTDHAFFEETLLNVAVAKKSKGAIKKWSFSRFLQIYDFKYVDILKTHFPEKWPSIRTELVTKLQKQVFTIEQRDAYAKILADEGLHDQLLDYLSTIRSLDLLPQYDQLLDESYQPQIQTLYKDLLTDYLNTHLGRQPSVKVKQLLWHLQNSGKKRFMDRLVRYFQKQFSDRRSLMEELRELY